MSFTSRRCFRLPTTRPWQRRTRVSPRLDLLESRCLLSIGSGPATLANLVASPAVQWGGFVNAGRGGPHTGSTTVVYSPSQIQAAYGFAAQSQNGSGQTIAIVDAYSDPNIASDLATFDGQFGLSAPPSFVIVNQNGNTSPLPPGNTSWGVEISLDVEWAHAIAPQANILLVEATSNSLGNLLTAVQTAASYSGVSVVSMSWGSSEFSTEASYDSYFTTPANHQGVTFVASSGDSGGSVEYPAASPNVLGVGGTTLNLTSTGTWSSESGWSSSGGGVSAYEPSPTYQSGLNYSRRASPDVAYDANPNTGFYVYDTYGYGGLLGVGGTSAGAPQWAALVALADQGRTSTLDSNQTLQTVYTLAGNSTTYSSNFHDITSGKAGRNRAGSGYDLVTGWGSPIANNLISSLSATTVPAVVTAPAASGISLAPTAQEGNLQPGQVAVMAQPQAAINPALVGALSLTSAMVGMPPSAAPTMISFQSSLTGSAATIAPMTVGQAGWAAPVSRVLSWTPSAASTQAQADLPSPARGPGQSLPTSEPFHRPTASLPDEPLAPSAIPVEAPTMPAVLAEVPEPAPAEGVALLEWPLPAPLQAAPRHEETEPIAPWEGYLIGGAAVVFWSAWELRSRHAEPGEEEGMRSEGRAKRGGWREDILIRSRHAPHPARHQLPRRLHWIRSLRKVGPGFRFELGAAWRRRARAGRGRPGSETGEKGLAHFDGCDRGA